MKLLKYNHPAKSKYKTDIMYEFEELRKELTDDMIYIMFEVVSSDTEDSEVVEKVKRK